MSYSLAIALTRNKPSKFESRHSWSVASAGRRMCSVCKSGATTPLALVLSVVMMTTPASAAITVSKATIAQGSLQVEGTSTRGSVIKLDDRSFHGMRQVGAEGVSLNALLMVF